MKVTLLILISLVSLNAQANIIDTTQTSQTAVSCNSFCGQFNNTPTSKNSNTWTTADDQMCFLLGAPTSDDPTVNVAPAKLPTLPTGMVDRCKYHNSQVEQYCLAYIAIEGNTSDKTDSGVSSQDVKTQQSFYGSKAANIALLTLDFATIGACTAACFSDPATGGIMNKVCGAAAVGTNVFEMTQTARMASDSTQAAIDSAFVGTGILGGTASYVNGMNQAGRNVAVGGLEEAAPQELSMIGRAKANQSACITAGIESVIAGLRAANIAAMNNISSQVCSNIQSLLSSGSPLPSNSGSIGGLIANNVNASGTAQAATQALLNQISNCSTINCVQSLIAGTSSGVNGSAATAGNLGAVNPAALNAVPNAQSLAAQAAQSGSATQGIASMGSAAGAPEGFGGALAQIANAAQKDAAAIGQALGMPLAQMPVVSAAKGASATDKPFSFDELLKKEEAAGKVAKTSLQVFKGAVQPQAKASPVVIAQPQVQYTLNDIPENTSQTTIFAMAIHGGSDNKQAQPINNHYKTVLLLVTVLGLGLIIFKRKNS